MKNPTRSATGLPREPSPASLPLLLGHSRAIVELRADIDRVARAGAPVVLLCGETGTGKDVVARLLHQSSPRNARPFVPVNCSALPAALIEDAFFGHERGAFTDAQESRAGLVESAAGGTLFLDEVGELERAAQAKLLRLLESGGVRRLGANEERTVDLAFLAATNQDLAQAVQAGSFRRDLYYRLNVVRLDLPPLRERREDVAELAEHFLHEFAQRFRKPFAGFEEEARRKLEAHAWPGNVRELRNAVERVVLLHAAQRVNASMLTLDEELPRTPVAAQRTAAQETAGDLRLETVERAALARALERAAGNQSRAARLLGVSRDTVRALMQKHHARLEVRVVFDEPGGAPLEPDPVPE